MPAEFSLSELVDHLRMGDATQVAYVDRMTGRLVIANETEGHPSVGTARYEPVPAVGNDEELALARRFCEQAVDPENRSRLNLALASASPIEAFEHAIYRCKIAHEWFPFREAHLVEVAKSWLDEHGIPYVDDLMGS